MSLHLENFEHSYILLHLEDIVDSGVALHLENVLTCSGIRTYIHTYIQISSNNSRFKCGGGGGRVVRMCWVNFQCQGVLLIWIKVGQGPIVLAVGAGGGCLDIFSLIYRFSFLLPLSGRRPDID